MRLHPQLHTALKAWKHTVTDYLFLHVMTWKHESTWKLDIYYETKVLITSFVQLFIFYHDYRNADFEWKTIFVI